LIFRYAKKQTIPWYRVGFGNDAAEQNMATGPTPVGDAEKQNMSLNITAFGNAEKHNIVWYSLLFGKCKTSDNNMRMQEHSDVGAVFIPH
jgi:hypothetical protein